MLEVMPHNQKLTIGYIAGAGHSGSTLTDLLLGSHPEIASFGELKNLDDVVSGRMAKGYCTCGMKMTACSLWKHILVEIDSLGLQLSAVRPNSDSFLEMKRALFQSLSRSSGMRILIDSSKTTQRLKLLLSDRSGIFEIKILHVVRDGRAVAFSNARKGRDFAESLYSWENENNKVLGLEKGNTPYMLIRYEDLVQSTHSVLTRIGCFLGVKSPQAFTLDWASRVRHNVGGNRMRRGESSVIRFDDDYLRLISDAEWEMSWNAIGATLARFGYFKERVPPTPISH